MSNPHAALLARLPKVELHCHLDGSPRLATLLELAQSEGKLRPGGVDELKSALSPGAERGSLAAYLAVFPRILELMQTEAALERIAYELAADAAAENVRWIEVRYCPVLNQKEGLSLDAVVAAVEAGLARAHAAHGVDSGQLICAQRNHPLDESLTLAKLACAHAPSGAAGRPGAVIGFDLGGAERATTAEAHAAAFRRARDANLWVTCHAGEDAGPESIADAIHSCAVDRIGHGVALVKDPALLRYVADHAIGIEACLTSNLQTGAVPSLAAHPLRALLAAGVRVSLATDNRLVSHTTVTQEYARAIQAFGLSREEIGVLALNGVESAFLPRARRASLRAEVEAALVA